MPSKNWKLQTQLLVREGTPHQQIQNCLKNNQRENGKNWSLVPDGCLIPGRTGRLTVGRNITVTLTLWWVVRWSRLALPYGPNRVCVSFPSPEDGSRSSFQNIFLSYLELWMKDEVQEPSDSEWCWTVAPCFQNVVIIIIIIIIIIIQWNLYKAELHVT
jgi:hypothetical protein